MKQCLLSLLLALLLSPGAFATHFVGVSVLDKDYLMVQFRDGEVHYRDDGTGRSAYLGHTFVKGDDTLLTFAPRLNVAVAARTEGWILSSDDDPRYAADLPAAASHRKSKPMNTDHTLTSELDHWIFLRVPHPLRQGCTYRLTIPSGTGADMQQVSVSFDIWNSPSEAVHVNLNGYVPAADSKSADLYYWLGDGGPRDYRAFEGKRIWLLNTASGEKTEVGAVRFWKAREDSRYEAGRKDLTGSSVWDISFRETVPAGTYRLVVEDVGCSLDFRIDDGVYRVPYQYAVRGYYYMRLGEPILPQVSPAPRQPRFIPGEDPAGFKVYLSELHPWHPDWSKNKGDVWDEPHFKKKEQSAFWKHRPKGHPINDRVRGGHSDAMDWDRHLAHVSNIYDMLLPFLLSGGRLDDDDLGIRESGNGIPDLLDEARNEVDFFLSIRDGEAYSQGVTNPDKDWAVMFQAGCTTMAAWANAANCAILAEAFRLNGNDSLCRYYRAEAIQAYRYAQKQSWTQLDDRQGIGDGAMRGRDFRQQAAAFLYNLTGERAWEDAFAADAVTPILNRGRSGWCQLWALAAYLICPHERHHDALYRQLLSSLQEECDSRHLFPAKLRPSRRGADDRRWQTSENLQLVMLAHYAARDSARRSELVQLMDDEAGWCLGRNPANIIEMTGVPPRSITDAYSTGRNDGVPGTHPGQTPFNGTESWSKGDGGDVPILLDRCYPSWYTGGWPRQESFFNQRYFWANSEFTPRETMRGKLALCTYLYSLSSGSE